MTSAASKNATTRERHTSLYLPDGNIVLEATSELDNPDVSRRVVLFRVHKSVLSRQSEVFADMFGLPASSASASESYDGVPVVELPDSAEDVESLLEVLYDPWYVPFSRCRPATLT